MPRISAITITRNEEKNIGYCLESLRWCDEIIIVDMESEDKTVEIAKNYTDKIYTHPKVLAFDIAKRYAVERASGDWIMLLDADEMVPASLAIELQRLSTREDIDIVEIPYRNYIMGAVMEYCGGNTPLPTFFRPSALLLTDKIHDFMHPISTAIKVRLESVESNSVRHFSYNDSFHFVDKLNRYTSIEAQQLYEKNIKFSYLTLLSSSVRQFGWRFITLRGYKDGPRGFFVCLMKAFYQALIYIKLWEMYEFEHEPVTVRYERIRKELLGKWKETGQ